MAKSKKFVEQLIAEDITSIVRKEITRLKRLTSMDESSLSALEKCSRIYATMMDIHRENKKSNIFSDMSSEELEDLIPTTDDETSEGSTE